MSLIKPTAWDDLGRVGRLKPWETAPLVEPGLDASQSGGADSVRRME